MKTVVAVLRGGPSPEYDISLRSGATVLQHLDPERYESRDVFIDKSGVWHVHGMATTPELAMRGADVAFNVIHGQYGEDGQVQRILDTLSIPYTGPGANAALLAFNKQTTRDTVQQLGIRVPYAVVVPAGADVGSAALTIFRSFPMPAIVKPVVGGSSIGIGYADSFASLVSAIEQARTVAPTVLIEEYIAGKEATVAVVDAYRNEPTYAFMPIEIVPPQGRKWLDYDAKYASATLERVPGHFTEQEKKALEDAAKRVHNELGMTHYSRSDFMVSPRGIFFLEVNSAPGVGLTQESLLPKALHAAGATVSDFLHHVVMLAL